MSEDWIKSLPPETRAKAQNSIKRMEELGTEKPEEWVESEITEGIAQMARFLILRRLWSDIDAWRDKTSEWVKHDIAEAQKKPESHFAEAGSALKRMVNAGVSVEDIGLVAEMVAYESTFNVLNLIDEGGEPDEEGGDLPGWALLEINAEGEATGRLVESLHESLLLR